MNFSLWVAMSSYCSPQQVLYQLSGTGVTLIVLPQELSKSIFQGSQLVSIALKHQNRVKLKKKL